MATARTFMHGIRVTETLANQQALRIASPSVIGLIATADDADPEYFPLNIPKLVTKISEARGKAGTSGTLANVLRDINDQARPVMVIIRVAEGSKTAAALPVGATPAEITAAKEADAADQAAKAIGTNVAGAYTGAYALWQAESITGVKPKIIGAPYLDKPELAQVLVAVAKRLHGMAYHELHVDSVSAAITAAEDFGDRESMAIYGRFLRFNVLTQTTEEISPIGITLGLRAALDASQGWHKSISNVVVNGVSGIAPRTAVHFDALDENTDANLLNEAKVTCLINKQGFRLWGNRTSASEDQFAFEPFTRTAQVLRESIAIAHFPYIDRPLVPGLARDIIEGVAALGRDLVANGQLLGFACWYDTELNETDQLKQGRLTIRYKYTPVPPLENLEFVQEYTDEYFSDFANRVANGVTA